jgi:oxygen-independent coproporphyrinogen III oxidase
MAGIYLHIPFCTKACHYCNFHFSTTHSLLPQVVAAMQQEIILKKDILPPSIHTIYFGGGTPSICSTEQLQSLLLTLQQHAHIAPNAEITLEANPNNITSIQQLAAWQKIGINRLSIGIQSFFEADLQWMNRAHNSTQAMQCLQWVQQSGFTNYSIDLIYGTPTLTNQLWQQNVQKAIDFNVPHISCYALTVEPNTALDKMIAKQKIAPISTHKQAEQFTQLMEQLQQAGYEHYEISNFCLPNQNSKHNTSYWQGKPYIGIGPSAHSFNGKHTRTWNIANNALYIKSLEQHIVPEEQEILTATEQLNEYIMIGLRTQQGIHLPTIATLFGIEKANTIQALAKKYITEKQLIISNQCIQLTNTGKLFADGIAASLFF